MKMKAVLRKNNCLAAIRERPMEITDDKWNEVDGNAISDLHLALADGVLSSVAEKNTAKEIWDTLAKLYEAKSLHNKIFLKRKLYTLRMVESTMVTDHINTLKTLFSQLTMLGHNIDENERAELLLQSLPDSYDQLIINLTNNNPADSLVFDDVAASVLNEETSTSDDGKIIYSEATTLSEGRKRLSDVWLIDLGATWHMTFRREWFHTYEPISGGSVYMGNDHALEITGIGTVKIKMFDSTIRTIREVRHVNGLKKDLLSLGQMDSHGYKTHVENGIMKIVKGALVLMKAEKIGANLYMLKGETLQEADACVASNGEESSMMWHLKLGHMSEQGLKILSKRKLLPGLKSVSLPFCKHCVTSKQHRLKFSRSIARSKCILDLIHSDVWESPDISMGGAKYMVTFIDDYSRRCWVYPIKKKSDVFPVFKEYKARVELESGKKIKCLRTDNGGEYTDGEFLAFCKQEGIQRQFTVAYTPQQNGVAVRMNRTLTERIRAMLRTAGLPNSFWAEAAKTAYYIVNRSPSTAIGLKTTMEMWTGKPADYSYLHAFGCPMYVMYNAQERKKLDAKSRRCIFLGYADGVKGYRLWDTTAHKIVISRDVIFVEDQLQRKDGDDGTVKEKSETVPVYVENNPEDSDFSEAAPEHEEQESVESESPEVRRSTRERRPPTWHSEYVTEINIAYCLLTEDGEPSTFHEALNSSDVALWMTAMQEEIELYTRIRHGNLYHYHVEEKPLETNGSTRSNVMAMTKWSERKEMSRVPYASAVGSLMFAMICTRPDIAQVVGAVSRYMANPGGEHWIVVKRILRYIRGTSDVALCYGGSEFTVRGYVDSDFAGDLEKRKSTTSYVFTLAGAAVSWVSKLQTVVALSTTEAEYMAATQACKEAIWIQRLLEELEYGQEKIYVFCDSQSALHIARNPAFHSRTKHIGVQYHFVREVLEDGSVDLQKIHTKENLADVLTKPINTDKFFWSRSSCGLAET
ncbi:Integrase catalytic domain-containing protein [Citrus sinensis]|nr:Integrase catalytic domain-containing protein [Citrus sinensis]